MHGWRKNAKDTSVVAISEKTHKVLQCQCVTKADDVVSQRHEMKGTSEIYRYFAESFNIVMNIFQDKRISFSDMQYNIRAQLAIILWNENVDR